MRPRWRVVGIAIFYEEDEYDDKAKRISHKEC